MTSISKSQFYHLQRRTSDVKFRPSKCWVPYFLIGGYSKKNCFSKKNLTLKKNPKKPFSQKKLFTEHEFEKCCEAKKMHKGHITRRKNFNKKKSKLRVWHSFRKNTLNHTAGTQKSVFFNFVFWEVFLYAVSTYCNLNCSLTKFLYTLLYSVHVFCSGSQYT